MINFYIIPTPIGNLKDLTLRALEVLRDADLILCEDTRKTKILLERFEIKSSLYPYHQRSSQTKIENIFNKIAKLENIVLVSEAGTPGISDPGNELIEKIIEKFPNNIRVIPLPGACALTTLASAAGANLNRFYFMGFPPNKKGRVKYFKKILASELPVIYYESPYRFLKNLKLLEELNTKKRNLKAVVGRELTKIHEEIIRGNIEEIISYYQENKDKIRGEFSVIIH